MKHICDARVASRGIEIPFIGGPCPETTHCWILGLGIMMTFHHSLCFVRPKARLISQCGNEYLAEEHQTRTKTPSMNMLR